MIAVNWNPDSRELRHFAIISLFGFSLAGLMALGWADSASVLCVNCIVRRRRHQLSRRYRTSQDRPGRICHHNGRDTVAGMAAVKSRAAADVLLRAHPAGAVLQADRTGHPATALPGIQPNVLAGLSATR